MATKKITLNELRSLVKQIIKETTLSHATDEDPIDDYHGYDKDIHISEFIKYDDNLEGIVSDFHSKIKNELKNILINTNFKRTNEKEDSEFLEELYTEVLKPLKFTISPRMFEYYVDRMVESKLNKK